MLRILVLFVFCLPLKAYCNNGDYWPYANYEISLVDNEILIVFVALPDTSGEAMYSAYVFKCDMDAPCLYNIGSEQCLLSYLDGGRNGCQDNQLLSKLLSPMSNELQNVETVYFIPAGLLHEIPLEYCVDINGRMFCEKYNVYRISSPSVLKHHGRKRKHYKKVSIWGGIDFHSDLSSVEQYEYPDSISLVKCSLGYLEDSYWAAKQINEELQEQGIECCFYYKEQATEGQFISKKWDDIDIILIETHGLFLNNENLAMNKGKDDPMENQALALAGACCVLEGCVVPNNIDDGILTAREISELDMHNVDLVVVSACKSALGKIRKDGVWGLMRGFKQAGARSLIMATDDIVDYVSGQLWIQLFHNLTKGMTKREALLEGLKHIRTMDEGVFSNPKYWTPFILIDGIE